MVKLMLNNKTAKSICIYLIIVTLASFALFIQVEAQFFTKSNSKSIPRMGRRSDPMLSNNNNNNPFGSDLALRRQLLSSILAKLGPNAYVVSV